MRLAFVVAAMVCVAVVGSTLESRAQSARPDSLEEAQKRITVLEQQIGSLKRVNDALNARLDKLRSASVDAEYRKAWVEYQKKKMDRNIRVYNWQDEATITIHRVTIILVLTALAISVGQIIFGMAFTHKGGHHSKQELETLELSANRIKIATTVSGLILLLVTFAFFYVYISSVYPLKHAG